jgi:hypothetical protein
MAYHNHDGHRPRWLYYKRCHAQCLCALLVLLPLRLRRLRRKLGDSRLGLRNAWSNTREESCIVLNHQCVLYGIVHLYAILVSKERWTKVCYCDECKCVFCVRDDCECVGAKDMVNSTKQEAQEGSRKGRNEGCILCLLIGKKKLERDGGARVAYIERQKVVMPVPQYHDCWVNQVTLD